MTKRLALPIGGVLTGLGLFYVSLTMMGNPFMLSWPFALLQALVFSIGIAITVIAMLWSMDHV